MNPSSQKSNKSYLIRVVFVAHHVLFELFHRNLICFQQSIQ